MNERFKLRVDEKTDMAFQLPPLRPQQASLERVKPDPAARAEESESRVLELEGVYVISVAARILEMHPQTLRKYERLGLISPVRTIGMLRLYSLEDIRKVMLIRHLMENLGLNLAGVEFALATVDNILGMWKRLSEAAEGPAAQKLIEQEIIQLFRNLNIPVEP